MPSAEEMYRDMLLQPAVRTSFFHEVFGALYEEGTNEPAIAHMNNLLHLPDVGPIEWKERGIQLATRGMISTVTQAEAMGAYHPRERNRPWNTLANRVIKKRRANRIVPVV